VRAPESLRSLRAGVDAARRVTRDDPDQESRRAAGAVLAAARDGLTAVLPAAGGALGVAVVAVGTRSHGGDEDKSITIDP
jgi:hypothetical protein